MQESTRSEAPPLDSSAKRAAPERNSRTKRLLLWGRIVLSLGLLAILARIVDWQGVRGAIQSVSMSVVGVAVLLILVAQGLCALRLQWLLRTQEIRIGFGYSLNLTLAGLFAGNFLPSTVGGDALKVVALRWRGHAVSTSLATVVMDRLTSLAAVTALVPTIWLARGLVPRVVADGLAFGACAAVVLGFAALWLIYWRHATVSRWLAARANGVDPFDADNRPRNTGRHTAPQGKTWAQRVASAAGAILARWVNSPACLTACVLISVLQIFTGQASLWLLASALGLDTGLLPIVAVYCLMVLPIMLPISVNGLGLQELGTVYFFTQLGATTEQATVVAVCARVFVVLASLPGALCLLLLRKDSPAPQKT